MSEDKDPIILVDGSSYLYRAYHALPPLTNSNNQPTGAIKGVISMIKRILIDHPDSPLAVVFDAKGKTFRHDMYSEYKANRPPMPEDLILQIEPIHRIISLMGIKLIMISGVEADDVIGTLAEQARQKKLDTVISTGDKDMTQLVCENVSVVNTMSGELLDEAGVKKKFGVDPDHITDYLALIGDKSDNVPGVDKVGPKTAVKWLEAYTDIKGVIKNAESIGGKVGENLRSSLDTLELAYELVTIKTDVELEIGIEDLKVQEPNADELTELYKELEFNSWLQEVPQKKPVQSAIDSSYKCISTKDDLEKLIKNASQAKTLALDTETTGLDYMDSDLVGISMCFTPGEAFYIPINHKDDSSPQLGIDYVLEELRPLLEDSMQKIIGQNIKFDMNILSQHGINISSIKNDTMMMSYVLDASATRHNLDALSSYYLGYKTSTFEDVAGKGVKQVTFDEVSIADATHYAAEDADITLRLYEELLSKLESVESLKKLNEDIEIPLIEVLSEMEQNGAVLNSKILNAQSKDLENRIKKIEKKAYVLAGDEFNLGSTKQLREIFFDKLGYRVIKKTPGGQPSTDEKVLAELAEEYELPKILLEHRTLSKLKSTYTDKLPSQISISTGKVHTSFHQAVTTTGRLSSSDPNLQNIPIRTEDGRRIRQAFEPSKGHKFVSADYSQIELRVMAHMSKDKGLLTAFQDGEDVHSKTASEVFNVDIDAVTTDLRRNAKAINFGLIYGISAFGLGKQLNINRNLAAEYMAMYFEKYPGVKKYMETTKDFAAENGYVETLFGRRLYLRDINASNAMRRQASERAAINAPVQGTAADIMKIAMIKMHQLIKETNVEAKLILQVHDELILDTPKKEIDEVIGLVTESMMGAASLDVPLEIDVGVGDNWDQAH
ncbi:DNA polymerase I [Gammaproteobacteria bacterium]|nr:DNA polymerase I [Gammaproteobacteria bacterium]MDB4816231.1 DNA polymerase I [Gammaproteobacteria bacterium]MDC0577075.1 DNA polymerase I [Gammaproteobacteria bacterium]MDC0590808.1 DNA polymerase I [Gammaproteobacteria bacterium]MDC1251785.1 DNA polymerase I [Gammaproteobacteria bacterium]